MKNLLFIITICLYLSNLRSYADFEDWQQEASAVCPSANDAVSNRVLIMIPGDASGKKSSGKFYDIGVDGKLSFRWEINWYSDASNVFIAQDSLVRIRHIIRNDGESLKELGQRPLLEFYQKGVLIKSYTVIELGDTGKYFGMTGVGSKVYSVFAAHEQLSPKIVKALRFEVNTIEQYRIIEEKAIDVNDIFKVDVISGDRIFFRISTGEILYRFKYQYTNTSVFR